MGKGMNRANVALQYHLENLHSEDTAYYWHTTSALKKVLE
jgi:hypothetical protein